MALSYGTTAGFSLTKNVTNEYATPIGTTGSVVTMIRKWSKIETTTETLPDSLSLPSLGTVPSWTRFELRLSNTDFARQSVTVVSYSTIA